ncbi:MAG: hypothetical protein H6551_00745 [Chitinophagales bacterium]|nr:hypothetical protein [Chitinophagaceae bacterium]MCB9063650.1 hypothetical protein [Chitinophagales bacterium]
MSTVDKSRYNDVARVVAIAVMLVAAAIRIWIYFENRNLILDEANIARNISERGFLELLKPLDYQQYAPPLFLWITKLNTMLFGMGEYVLRIYPLFCGIGAIWVLYKVLRKLIPAEAIWLPLSMFGFSYMLIRYASEVKQYMPDAFIALLLIFFALNIDIRKVKPGSFFLYWVLIGSLAIWSSMPSVFVLSGVGGYYFLHSIGSGKRVLFLILPAIAVVWMLQFGIYYFSVLQEQAGSEYLQNYHKIHFLFATPWAQSEWNHNYYAFNSLVYKFIGMRPHVIDVSEILMVLSLLWMLISNRALLVLLLMPILTLGFAASIEQFSVMPRVALFSMPILIIIITYSFGQLHRLRTRKAKPILVLAGLFVIVSNVWQTMEFRPFKYEEITEGMTFLKEKNVQGNAISVYHSTVPAFIYYTTIHPDKGNWESIKNADFLSWQTNYDSLGWFMGNVWSSRIPLGFLYTNFQEFEIEKRNGGIAKSLDLVDKLDKPYVKAYIYIKPEE